MFWAHLLVAVGLSRPTLYVAPSGADMNDGLSRNRPLATIVHAVEIARGFHGAKICLAPGDYLLDSPIRLGDADSNLTLMGEGRRLPRLLSGRLVRKWKPATHVEGLPPLARGHVFQCEIPHGVTPGEYRRRGFGLPQTSAALEVFFDGKPAQLAQWPNPGAGDNGWARVEKVAGPQSLMCADKTPFGWRDTGDILALGYWQFDWAESYEHVTRLAPSSQTIELGHAGEGCREYTAGRRFRLLNAIEALDQPNEWFYDRHAGLLYFWPPKPLGQGEVMVSSGEEDLVQILGASHVTLRSLLLEGGRGGGVRIEGGSHNTVEGCVIRNLGTFGVSISNSPDSGVRGCDLTGLGDYGIALNGGDWKTLTSGRLFAENNRIWAYSRWRRTYQPGVSLSGVGARVERNLIADAPHNGILLSGNDHQILRNDFRRLCMETGDAGAIYMGRNPVMRGVQIVGNRFAEMGPTVTTRENYTGVMCVYLDDCWCGARIAQNLFLCRATGVMIGGGQDNSVERNAFVGCDPAVHLDARGKGWAKDMFNSGWEFAKHYEDMLPYWALYAARYPALANYWKEDPAFPKGNAIQRNLSVGGRWLNLQDGLTERDFVHQGNVVNPPNPTDPYRWVGVAPGSIGPLAGPRPLARG